MKVSSTDNFLMAGLGLMMTACVLFLLINSVMAIKTTTAVRVNDITQGLENQLGHENNGTQQASIGENDSSINPAWALMFILSLAILIIGVRVVSKAYSVK